MLFKRRQRPPLLTRLAGWVWPKSGFRRAATYVGYRLLRLPGTPYTIAGGFAWGAAVSFTPFIGLHFVLAALAAWVTRCSLFASAIGTVVGNPWSFPFIWAWIYACGAWILGGDTERRPPLEGLQLLFHGLWERVGHAIGWATGLEGDAGFATSDAALDHLAADVLLPMAVGAVPNVILVWLAFYLPLRRLVAAYQHRRAVRRRKHWRTAGGEAN